MLARSFVHHPFLIPLRHVFSVALVALDALGSLLPPRRLVQVVFNFPPNPEPHQFIRLFYLSLLRAVL
jgi:hypothetical protein